MKITMLLFALCLSMCNILAQNETSKGIPVIKVPDFADPEVKHFYNSYADHLIQCIKAIREKNKIKVVNLFKNPGEQLVTKEKEMAKELVKNPAEKQKYIQFAKQAYPFIKELEASVYYKEMFGNR